MVEGFQGLFQNDISKRDSFMSNNENGTPQSRTYIMNDIAAILGIGHTSTYKLANSGLFTTIRIFRKSFEDWLKMEWLDNKIR